MAWSTGYSARQEIPPSSEPLKVTWKKHKATWDIATTFPRDGSIPECRTGGGPGCSSPRASLALSVLLLAFLLQSIGLVLPSMLSFMLFPIVPSASLDTFPMCLLWALSTSSPALQLAFPVVFLCSSCYFAICLPRVFLVDFKLGVYLRSTMSNRRAFSSHG